MNNKQRKTLSLIFEVPIRADIRWTDVISLFKALGAAIKPGAGSRVGVLLNSEFAVFHEPHPMNIAKKSTVKEVREFLIRAGVQL